MAIITSKVSEREHEFSSRIRKREREKERTTGRQGEPMAGKQASRQPARKAVAETDSSSFTCSLAFHHDRRCSSGSPVALPMHRQRASDRQSHTSPFLLISERKKSGNANSRRREKRRGSKKRRTKTNEDERVKEGEEGEGWRGSRCCTSDSLSERGD